ncbi:LysR family transcriptional regulator [Sphingobium sp. EM0848]|uniref:LysR family transcriptional regulator n=1 Tax=Sphingobium sp. EM0848 TaxID=2743473 RepID=UPI00159BFAD2|nr:LysR family transcriptional regulator [Sphingobium sp. EM0848]
MDRAQLPLNALRAFEAAARHLNFTHAALELCVSQGAVSHQVALLEKRLGISLFRRLPRGLALTDEGQALVPTLAESFDRMGAMLDRFSGGQMQEVLTIGVVGTFAGGWLMDRLPQFTAAHPHVDLRILLNNNRVDLAGEGLDGAIRFGDGSWHGTEAQRIMAAPLTPLCDPRTARRISGDWARLSEETLLRSYRASEWPLWFETAGGKCPPLRGPMFDNSVLMVRAAIDGHGVALAPANMFEQELRQERIVRPFPIEVTVGAYWLTRLHSRAESPAFRQFREWLLATVRDVPL